MVQILKNKKVKVIICLMIILIMLVLTMKQSYAAGDVSSVIQQAWKQMESQIKNIVNNVVFPVIDIILAVFFFAKLAMAYFDYRKQGQFDWTTPAILFACCFLNSQILLHLYSYHFHHYLYILFS